MLLTGMGKRRAYRAVRDRLRQGGVEFVLSTGFSGATRPGLRVGDLVGASEVLDVSTGERWIPSRSFERNGSLTVGAMVTAERLLGSPLEKEQAGRRYGAIAVDMETAAVAKAAQEMDLPWAAIRVILDPMEISIRWWRIFPLIKAIRVASGSLATGVNEEIKRWI